MREEKGGEAGKYRIKMYDAHRSKRATLQQQQRCAPHGPLGERDTASGQGDLSR